MPRPSRGETVAIGQTAAASGLGGIGKTHLANEFVHRYGQFFAGGVYSLSFADPAAVPAEVAACGGPGVLALHPAFHILSMADQVQLVQAAWQIPLPRHHRPDLSANDTDLDAIAAELDDLPLALYLAGSYLARYRQAVIPMAYLAQLRQPDLLAHLPL